MKKIFSFAMGLLAMTTLQAANTEVARLTLTGQGGTESSNVTLRVDPSVSTAQTTSFFGATDEIGQVNIYAIEGTATYSAYKKDNLSKLELQIITNRRDAADQHYTLTFNVPTLTDGLTLFDRATRTATPITHNGTYEFDVNTTLHPDFVAGTNYTVKERFYINYVAPDWVYMEGDFDNPDGSSPWIATSGFTYNGTSYSIDMVMEANAWYHFQLKEHYGENDYIAADGSSFDRDHKSHYIPVDGWHDQLTLHTDAAGTYTFTWNDLTDNLTITFPDVVEVTTNANGLATFSYASDLKAVEDVKLYKGAISGEYLDLDEVYYVKAGEGVIVYGAASTKYHFYAGTGTTSDFSGNELKPATAWAGQGYVLSGSSLYIYEGENFPANKAFLAIPSSGGAPRRISLRFDETTAIDNVEASEVKAEKFVENGVIYIRRGNEVFNLQGQIVK